VTVIDAATNTVLAHVRVSTNPRSIVWNSADNKVFVACYGSYYVYVIDGVTNQYVKMLSTGRTPYDLAVNQFDNKVYVANNASYTVSVLQDSEWVGLEEVMSDEPRTMNVAPTVVRSVLFLQNGDCTGTRSTRASVGLSPFCALLDISGRKVSDLHPGANDVRALAPGVYFVQSSIANRHSSIRRVVKVH